MRHLGRWLLWTFALLAAAFILLQGWYAAHIWWWREHAPRETAFMAMRLSQLQERHADARLAYKWVPYDRISVQLKRAVIAAEDAKFVEHEGFDWEGIQQALDKNTRKGRVVAGGSTITQQLAKNLFLSAQRSYWRKAEEALITLMLEAILDKRRILELYLNVIEWGDGIFGAEVASRHYFGLSSAALTAEQAARLAAMAPNPRYYEKHPDARGLAHKTTIILARMPAAELP
jgi:monofunctional biosynthetic peptidoglycan transglycosylase